MSAGVSVRSGVEAQSLSVGDFPGSLWPYFSIYHLASALGLEGQRNSLRRVSLVIFGGGPFLLRFLGFVRGGEYRRSADFQLISARGSAPSFSPF